MAGGLMDLVARGAQDMYITGNPEITMWKSVYRRHTNFSCETIEQTLSSGNVGFGKKCSVEIHRSGDLVSNMYLKVSLAAVAGLGARAAYVARLGHHIVKTAEVEIGGGKMDKHYGTWLNIYYELVHKTGHESGYARMIGDVPEMTDMATSLPAYTLYIPLQFWFNRHAGLALPLIALQYHETRLHFEFESVLNLVSRESGLSDSAVTSAFSMSDVSLLVNYVYLDNEERMRFAQFGHEYLIEEVQMTNVESADSTTRQYTLGFNHPTKEIVWALRAARYNGGLFLADSADNFARELVRAQFCTAGAGAAWADQDAKLTVDDDSAAAVEYLASDVGGLYSKVLSATVHLTAGGDVEVPSVSHTLTQADVSQLLSEMADTRTANHISAAGTGVVLNLPGNYGMYLDGSGNPVASAVLQFNSQDRFDRQDGDYFNNVQPYQHHTNTPCVGINVYSFALKPEEHQPTGAANLSRIDTTTLNVTFVSNAAAGVNYLNSSTEFYIFAVSNNVVRFMGGLAGKAYVS